MDRRAELCDSASHDLERLRIKLEETAHEDFSDSRENCLLLTASNLVDLLLHVFIVNLLAQLPVFAKLMLISTYFFLLNSFEK